jgi:hypothetical protein
MDGLAMFNTLNNYGKLTYNGKEHHHVEWENPSING